MTKIKLFLKENIIFSFLFDVIFRIIYYWVYIFSNKKLEYLLNDSNDYSLVITHNLGGGINQYLKNMENTHLIVLHSISKISDYYYKLENYATKKKIVIKKSMFYYTAGQCKKILIMSLFSFRDLDFIMNELKRVSKISQLIFYLHDYHCICPGLTLIQNNRFCGVECNRFTCEFKINKQVIKISVWRDKWESFLSSVALIYVFSNSSKDLFSKVYRDFKERIIVQPHSMDYYQFDKITQVNKELCIGVFGNINSDAKGLTTVSKFLEFSRNRKYKIFLHGYITRRITGANIFYNGKYINTDIKNIIEAEKISVVFFPSICPETFSYLVSELIILGIPIIGFNVGAQGDKINQYNKGFIINDFTNEAILKAAEQAIE